MSKQNTSAMRNACQAYQKIGLPEEKCYERSHRFLNVISPGAGGKRKLGPRNEGGIEPRLYVNSPAAVLIEI